MNEWVGLAVGMIGVLAGVAAMFRWFLGVLDSRIDSKLDSKLEALDSRIDSKLDSKLDATLDAKLAPIHGRLDALDVKVDHVAEVVDLRLRPLEADMALVKQHLLGTPAA